MKCLSKTFSLSIFFCRGSFVFTFLFSSNIQLKGSICWSIGIGISGFEDAGDDVKVWPNEAVEIAVDVGLYE